MLEKLHLTDYSEGMLQSAEKTVKEIQDNFPEKRLVFELAKKDAENFTYDHAGFDRIMANHMLYHMKKETRPGFYRTVRELLKPAGIFSCSLIGQQHNREIQGDRHGSLQEGMSSLLQCLHSFCMFFDGAEAFLAYDMFDLAGVFFCNVFWNTEGCQALGENIMPFVDHISDGFSFFGQIDKSSVCNGDMILLTKMFHRYTDTGFFKSEFSGNVYGAYYR